MLQPSSPVAAAPRFSAMVLHPARGKEEPLTLTVYRPFLGSEQLVGKPVYTEDGYEHVHFKPGNTVLQPDDLALDQGDQMSLIGTRESISKPGELDLPKRKTYNQRINWVENLSTLADQTKASDQWKAHWFHRLKTQVADTLKPSNVLDGGVLKAFQKALANPAGWQLAERTDSTANRSLQLVYRPQWSNFIENWTHRLRHPGLFD
ncbi:MAG: hypothetical protein SFZ03_01950 [Candidatus Melainabacteria bacterium]|nr:hypothetical protein [Candidatus Melainabacteria bacterium]